jgi:hypothetical protein
VGSADVVLAAGTGHARLAQALAPWVREVHPLEADRQVVSAFDWAFLTGAPSTAGDAGDGAYVGLLRSLFHSLRPGGHLAITIENRWGLHFVADWRVAPKVQQRGANGHTPERHGLRWHRHLMRAAGADQLRTYALLPSHDAPRAIIPVDPPCPPDAQKMALDQVWQRATPTAALARALLGVLVSAELMRWLYPHYLLVGRKPC